MARTRCSAAVWHLVHTALGTAETGFVCGYSDQAHFHTAVPAARGRHRRLTGGNLLPRPAQPASVSRRTQRHCPGQTLSTATALSCSRQAQPGGPRRPDTAGDPPRSSRPTARPATPGRSRAPAAALPADQAGQHTRPDALCAATIPASPGPSGCPQKAGNGVRHEPTGAVPTSGRHPAPPPTQQTSPRQKRRQAGQPQRAGRTGGGCERGRGMREGPWPASVRRPSAACAHRGTAGR